MNNAEIEQYRRHISLEGFGLENQQKLKNASVLVVGAGGLGCPVLQYLAAAGVGNLGIVDDDLVEISNLQRQVLFNHDDQGKPKAISAAQKLGKMNPLITIRSYQERLTKKNCESLLQNYEIIVDGTDNFTSRYLINDACVLYGKTLVHGSINQFEGMVSVFNYNQGPTYRCLFPEQPDPSSIPSCAEAGVLGVLPGIIGCWQALEVIKIITSIGEPLSGKVLLHHALTHCTRTISLNALPESRNIKQLPEPLEVCMSNHRGDPHTAGIKEISEHELHEMMLAEKELQILDVREDWERQQISLQPSLHLPLGQLMAGGADDLSTLGISPAKKLVVYCKAGVRSRMACQSLENQGFSDLFNLSNGMDGWSQEFPGLCIPQ